MSQSSGEETKTFDNGSKHILDYENTKHTSLIEQSFWITNHILESYLLSSYVFTVSAACGTSLWSFKLVWFRKKVSFEGRSRNGSNTSKGMWIWRNYGHGFNSWSKIFTSKVVVFIVMDDDGASDHASLSDGITSHGPLPTIFILRFLQIHKNSTLFSIFLCMMVLD